MVNKGLSNLTTEIVAGGDIIISGKKDYPNQMTLVSRTRISREEVLSISTAMYSYDGMLLYEKETSKEVLQAIMTTRELEGYVR